jgi:hypothetical protein
MAGAPIRRVVTGASPDGKAIIASQSLGAVRKG